MPIREDWLQEKDIPDGLTLHVWPHPDKSQEAPIKLKKEWPSTFSIYLKGDSDDAEDPS